MSLEPARRNEILFGQVALPWTILLVFVGSRLSFVHRGDFIQPRLGHGRLILFYFIHDATCLPRVEVSVVEYSVLPHLFLSGRIVVECYREDQPTAVGGQLITRYIARN